MRLFVILPIFLFPVLSLAEGWDPPKNQLSTAGGIASPSATTSLGENPAGLIKNEVPKIQGQLVRGTESSTWGYGAGFYTGDGTTGGAVAVQGFNAHNTSPGRVLLLNWGLASVFPNLNAAMGFTGNFQLDKQGEVQGTGTGTTWCVDAGITFNPKEKSRFSLAVFQILNNIDAVGAGYALDLGKSATFVIDGAHTTSQGTIILKPGINMALDNFQLSSSFGFRVLKQSGWTWIRPGLTAGLGVNVNDRIRIEGYFNHFARAMGTLTVRL